MKNFNELVEKLNSLKITQKSIDWKECIPDDIWSKCFSGNFKEVKRGLCVDTHRWYETSISVIEIYERFLGIRHITNLFSEQMECEDCYVTIEFFEMEEIKVVSYKRLD